MPNILDRISSILRANVNDTLDRAENPEVMLNQIIRDMQDALRQADSDIADQIAQKKMIEADLDGAQKNAAAWQQKAEFAVAKGADALAREALARANDYDDQVEIYQRQLDAQSKAVAELKAKRDQLQSKFESALRGKDNLIARAKSAQAQARLTQVTRKASVPDYTSDLDRMERRIKEMEARADAEAEVAQAHTSLDEQFGKLGGDDRVEKQLAELKAKVGKS